VAGQVLDIFQAAGRQVVENRYLMALCQKPFGQVRTDETRPPSDQCPHPDVSLV
jgi:hypothetical protein